jgi:predicted dehydrogenase
MTVVRVAVLGAGVRGREHGRRIRRCGGVIAAVAEPDAGRRERFAAEHGVPAEACFAGWRELADRAADRIDAVLITTQDSEHADPCVRFAELGKHVLCEKPMAPSEEDAVRMVAAVERAGVTFAIVHPLRYMPYTDVIKTYIRDGVLGRVLNVQNLEPVGAWHFAHSYVRGQWRREAESSSLLMAKCCHDLDWLSHLLDEPPVRVSSFGRLSHFTPDNRPAGAADRCLDCAVEPDCPYSAPRLYRACLGDRDREHWPLNVVTPTLTEAGITTALATGPYGRCVYACDNDVVDHQVVALDFASGATATHTVTAFTEMRHRETRIFGTHGSIECDGHQIVLHDFRTHPVTTVTTIDVAGRRKAGFDDEGVVDHSDGDRAAIRAFLTAVATGDTSHIRSGARESLNSHRTVWAAERARRTGTVITLNGGDVDPQQLAG